MLNPPLTDPAYLKQVLAKHGVKPSRQEGQNFLISDEVIAATVALMVSGPHCATELGAGIGPLTQALLQAGFTVRAIERDRRLAALLPQAVSSAARERLELVIDDLRTVPWAHEVPYQLVGNIPYNLSGFIIRRLTELTPAPTLVTLLLQQEVAQRLVAHPPDMHLNSVAVQLWGTPTLVLAVPATCFWPAPEVDSALIAITPHLSDHQRDPQTREGVLRLARHAFQQRRKQLGGTLPTLLHKSRAETATLLTECGLAPTQRPQELSVEQWVTLYQTIQET